MDVQSRDRLPTTTSDLIHRIETRFQAPFGREVRGLQVLVLIDGLVLRGRVSTYYAKQLVQQMAKDISGLSIVANEIEIQ